MQYDDARAVEIYAAESAFCVRDDLLANLLSARVVAFQLLREGFEHKIVFVEEKSDRLHSRTEPSRGVDARRQTEHHILRSQFFRTREYFNAAARAFCAHFQPVICDDAVVADQGHNVRNGCDGAYVKILFVFVAEQRAHKRKRHSRAAQIRKTSASVDFGVGNDAIGQLFLRLVVVGDDKVYPLRAQIFRLFDCGDAAVHGDDEVGTTVRNDAFECPDVHSVSVRQTVGDEIVRVRTFGAQREHKYGYGADAVAVVVAENEYLFSVLDGTPHSFGGFAHPEDVVRRRKRGKRGLQKTGDVPVAQSSPPQKAQQACGYAELFRRVLFFCRKYSSVHTRFPLPRLAAACVRANNASAGRRYSVFHFFFLNVVFFFEYL